MASPPELPISAADVVEAARRIHGVAHRTPVLTSRTLDGRAGAAVLLKAECFQRSGSFKFRGAYNAIASLAPDERAAGVVAFSSGNHAQAVALAARLLGVRAVILMPDDAPAAKVAATRGYGAEVVTYDRYAEDREERGHALLAERGGVLVPPFDHPLVMAGQGTAALELVDDVGALDVLVAPVSGGGLISGCAVAARHRLAHVRIVGVEPAAGDDVRRSLREGRRVVIDVPRTIADGLQVTSPGRLTFPVLQRLVDEVVTVSDEEMVDAMRFAFEHLKVVLEPSGAAGLAAVLTGRAATAGSGGSGGSGGRVGVILSGGNVGAERFCQLLADR